MRTFYVEDVAQEELEEGGKWYEGRQKGLGAEFVAEVKRVLLRIAQTPSFKTAPILRFDGGVVRREFVNRFPYVVIFVETDTERSVFRIGRGNSDPAVWRSRV